MKIHPNTKYLRNCADEQTVTNELVIAASMFIIDCLQSVILRVLSQLQISACIRNHKVDEVPAWWCAHIAVHKY